MMTAIRNRCSTSRMRLPWASPWTIGIRHTEKHAEASFPRTAAPKGAAVFFCPKHPPKKESHAEVLFFMRAKADFLSLYHSPFLV